MQDEFFEKLQNTTLSSAPLTHSRLKHFAGIAQTTEDHISRIGLGLSFNHGEVEADWLPNALGGIDAPMSVITGKHIRGKTLFKEDLLFFIALASQHQDLSDYSECRSILRAHWERGVQMLTEKAQGNPDWIRITNSLLASS
jgi:hypothetical protein